MLTIDASVLVAAGAADDAAHEASLTFLREVLRHSLPVHQPTLALVEVAAAIARRTKDPGLAREAGLRLLRMPGLILHSLDVRMASEAAAVSGRALLRGADAVYAATALRHATVLVTLDDELRKRTASFVPTESPTSWLDSRS